MDLSTSSVGPFTLAGIMYRPSLHPSIYREEYVEYLRNTVTDDHFPHAQLVINALRLFKLPCYPVHMHTLLQCTHKYTQSTSSKLYTELYTLSCDPAYADQWVIHMQQNRW